MYELFTFFGLYVTGYVIGFLFKAREAKKKISGLENSLEELRSLNRERVLRIEALKNEVESLREREAVFTNYCHTCTYRDHFFESQTQKPKEPPAQPDVTLFDHLRDDS